MEHKNLASTGLAEHRCHTLRNLAKVVTDEKMTIKQQLELYSSIDGIGNWTIKGANILCGIDNNIALVEDKWIRKRLAQYVGHKRILTIAEAKKAFEVWPEHESMMSMVFWRLQPWGVVKLSNDEIFIRQDFV